MAATYCATSDVANLLNITIDGNSTPSSTTVTEIIERKQDYIDNYTMHAFRSVTVSDEHHNLTNKRYYPRLGFKIKLNHRSITAFSSGTDKIEVWDGSSWVDWVSDSNYSEGRENDYYIDYKKGFVYLKHRSIIRHSDVRITYRYGESTVPADIEDACTKLTAYDIVMADQYFSNFPEGASSSGVDLRTLAEKWKEDAMEILRLRKEIGVIVE